MEQTKILFFVLLMCITLMAAGCEEKSNPVSKVGDRLIGAYERSSTAAGQSTLKGIKDAIRAYHISNGEYPDSIEEVQRYMGARIDTGLYQYDPDTGEISLLE